jgi:uracil-DNA glycosylase
MQNCRGFLLREIAMLVRVKVAVALGGIAFKVALDSLGARAGVRRPKFAHGVEHAIGGGITLIGSYHPSQQNTFTGRLTEPMLDRIFNRAAEIIAHPEHD